MVDNMASLPRVCQTSIMHCRLLNGKTLYFKQTNIYFQMRLESLNDQTDEILNGDLNKKMLINNLFGRDILAFYWKWLWALIYWTGKTLSIIKMDVPSVESAIKSTTLQSIHTYKNSNSNAYKIQVYIISDKEIKYEV